MRDKLKVTAVTVLLRCSLIGTLLVAAANAWSAPEPPPAKNSSNATGGTSLLSKSAKEDATKKEKEAAATPWVFLGAIVTALGAVIASIITAINAMRNADIARLSAKESDYRSRDKERELAVSNAKLDEQKSLALAYDKFIHDLRSEYDKDLRKHRIDHYQKLMAWMVNLPKYPKPEPLTAEGVRTLSLAFRDWYFAGGGLFLSENEDPETFSEASRERYFDFQEGCKIVLQKIDKEWKFAGDAAKPADLRKYFGRDEKWNPPKQLTTLINESPQGEGDELRGSRPGRTG